MSRKCGCGLGKFFIGYLVVVFIVCALLYRPLPEGFTTTVADRVVMHVVEPALRSTYYWPSRAFFSKPSGMVWWTRAVLNNLCKLIGPVFTDNSLVVNTTSWNGVVVRTYMPPNNMSYTGAVFFIHGGGFALGNIDMYDSLSGRMAKALNVLFVSVEYRLSPETPFPGGLNDCENALEYLYQNGYEEFGIDTEKIVVMGDSAGGNLATVLAQRRTASGKLPAISGQVLIYPLLQMVDLQTTSYRYFTQRLTGYALVDPESVAYYYMFYAGIDMDEKGYLVKNVLASGHISDRHKNEIAEIMAFGDDIKRTANYGNQKLAPFQGENPSEEARRLLEPFLVNPDFSPLMRKNLSGLPDTFVMTCEFDILRDEGIIYARRLKAARVKTLHKHYENGFHAMLNFHNELTEATRSLKDIIAWTLQRVR